MHELQHDEYGCARSIFRELADFNIFIEAVLAGTAPGEVWVDDARQPRVGFMSTADGHFLAGDVNQTRSYRKLKATIPPVAYLKFSPPQWEEKLPDVWVNRIARPLPRCYFHLHIRKMSDWRERVPQDFRVVPIDADLVRQRDLKNLHIVTDWMEDWFSPEDFFQHGFGFCLIHDRAIASVCMTDCVNEQRCEIGISTVPDYRRRGLAAIAAAATVEYAIAHDVTSIGWHCLRSNAGSITVAEKVGFVKVNDYCAYATSTPAENASDLSPVEWREWAEYYQQFIDVDAWFALRAAEAWALAGDSNRALSRLDTLTAGAWAGSTEVVEHNWALASIRDLPEFKTIVAQLSQRTT